MFLRLLLFCCAASLTACVSPATPGKDTGAVIPVDPTDSTAEADTDTDTDTDADADTDADTDTDTDTGIGTDTCLNTAFVFEDFETYVLGPMTTGAGCWTGTVTDEVITDSLQYMGLQSLSTTGSAGTGLYCAAQKDFINDFRLEYAFWDGNVTDGDVQAVVFFRPGIGLLTSDGFQVGYNTTCDPANYLALRTSDGSSLCNVGSGIAETAILGPRSKGWHTAVVEARYGTGETEWTVAVDGGASVVISSPTAAPVFELKNDVVPWAVDDIVACPM